MKTLNEYPELLNQRELAEYLGYSLATLERDRFVDKGVPYIKIGRKVRYHRDDVRAYLDKQRVETNFSNPLNLKGK